MPRNRPSRSTTQAVRYLESVTSLLGIGQRISRRKIGTSVATTWPAGRERWTIRPTENASRGLARMDTPCGCGGISSVSPTGAPSAITRAAIPADIRASWAGSLSPTTAMSPLSGVKGQRGAHRSRSATFPRELESGVVHTGHPGSGPASGGRSGRWRAAPPGWGVT